MVLEKRSIYFRMNNSHQNIKEIKIGVISSQIMINENKIFNFSF